MAAQIIDIRVVVDENDRVDGELLREEELVHQVLAENEDALSVVVLRNDGFGNLLPDEATRQER